MSYYVDEVTRCIPLSQGQWALVSIEDFRRVMKRKWSLVSGDSKSTTYAETNIKQGGEWKRVLLHRFLMEACEGQQVDHKNHDGLDCRRGNMRLATHAQNMRNTRSHKDSVSRFKGVSMSNSALRWQAQIRIEEKNTSLGLFDSEVAAAEAYDHAAAHIFGEFAHLNFPENRERYLQTPFGRKKQKPKGRGDDSPYAGPRQRGNGWAVEVGGWQPKYLGVFPTAEHGAIAWDLVTALKKGLTAALNFPSLKEQYGRAAEGGYPNEPNEFKAWLKSRTEDIHKLLKL